jgi:hypothetical protein
LKLRFNEIQNPNDFRALWPWVREGLDAVVRKTSPDWLVEDIYAMLKTGLAKLVVATTEDGALYGFFVWTATQRPHSGKMDLCVMAGWTDPKKVVSLRERKEALAQAASVIRQIAASHNLEGAYFLSPRRGFERVGFKVNVISYTI